MKILSIGNSYSADAHRWLSTIAKTGGFDIKAVNLFIGGCTLQSHWNNFINNNADYEIGINGLPRGTKIDIAEALKTEEWDIVTLQQASFYSGKKETYEPYLSNLAKVVRAVVPNAKLYFHQTWAYEIDFDEGIFSSYDNSQRKMYECIVEASEVAAKSINAELIPVGTAIQAVRQGVPEFDYQNGGLSLCRDGRHLSLDYGRYTAAAMWYRTITGQKIDHVEIEGFDTKLIEKINAVINGI